MGMWGPSYASDRQHAATSIRTNRATFQTVRQTVAELIAAGNAQGKQQKQSGKSQHYAFDAIHRTSPKRDWHLSLIRMVARLLWERVPIELDSPIRSRLPVHCLLVPGHQLAQIVGAARADAFSC